MCAFLFAQETYPTNAKRLLSQLKDVNVARGAISLIALPVALGGQLMGSFAPALTQDRRLTVSLAVSISAIRSPPLHQP
jgi:hypothetical protein